MWLFDNERVPDIRTELPGPIAQKLLARDDVFVSPSYTRIYPLVVERGSGAVIETSTATCSSTSPPASPSARRGTAIRKSSPPIRDQAGKLLHMSGTDFYYDAADRPGRDAGRARARRVAEEGLLHQQRGGGGRSGAEAGPLAHAVAVASSPSSARSTAGPMGRCRCRRRSSCIAAASRRWCRTSITCRSRDCDDRCDATALHATDRGDLFQRTAPPDEVAAIFVEPIQGEGGYHRAAAGLPAARCERCATSTASCWSSTKCRAAWAAPARCSPSSTGASSRTSSAWRRGSPAACRSGRSSRRRTSWTGPPAATRARSAATPSRAGRRWRRSSCSNASTWPTPTRAASSCVDGLRDLADQHDCLAHVRGLGLMTAVDVVNEQGDYDPKSRDAIIQAAFQRGLLLLGLRRIGACASARRCA